MKKTNFLQLWIVVVTLLLIPLTYFVAISVERNVLALEERMGSQETNPVVSTHCVSWEVDDPPGISFVHPVVMLDHTPFLYHHWFEVTVREGDKERDYLVSSGEPPNVKDDLDGWMSDVRSGQALHVFTSDAEYTLRVWRHPYETVPEFTDEELVFEVSFEVPSCD